MRKPRKGISDKILEYPGETIEFICCFLNDYRLQDVYKRIKEKYKERGISLSNVFDEVFEEGKEEGKISTLSSLVRKGIITVEQAAEESDMSVEEFEIRSESVFGEKEDK